MPLPQCSCLYGNHKKIELSVKNCLKKGNLSKSMPFLLYFYTDKNATLMKHLPLVLIFLVFISCDNLTNEQLFKRLSSDDTNINFVNKIEETETDNVLNYEYFYNGGGVAAADFNNDGLTDLYFTANQGEDKLYINKGKLQFEDVTQTAFGNSPFRGEWKTGVTVVDINNDGWQDIYVSVSGNVDKPELRKNKLYINQAKGGTDVSFVEKAAEYGLDLATFTTQTAFFDYDKDGDLDAYILNHNVKDFNRFDVEAVHAMRDSLAGHRLMRNDNGKFTDVSIAAGIKGNPIGFGLGISISDLNQDGWPDIYISNDYIEPDYMYFNNHNGTFTDVIKETTDHVSYFSMGNDVGDINNDLLPDVFTADMLPEDNKRQKLLFGPDKYEAYLSMLRNGFHPEFMRNMLQINSSTADKTTFTEVGQLAGISNTDWSWAPLMADLDNDGFKDLFITNGYLRDYTNNDFIKFYSDGGKERESVLEVIKKMPSTLVPNYIFRNEGNINGSVPQFTNKQKDWGFDTPVISNGAVYADLDNDGDLEIITNNINEKAFVYKNLSTENSKNSYLSISLEGHNAYNAKVYVYANQKSQFREFSPNHGFQSSMMIPLHFGLEKTQKIDSVIVIWPNDRKQKLDNIAVNQLLKIKYVDNLPVFKQSNSSETPLFKENNNLNFEHGQIVFNDFSRQFLLPQMYSFQGPKIAKGDINKDGLEDMYIGGGKGFTGALLIQQKNGKFLPTNQSVFKQDELCTDTDAVFFDADQDGDLDLYVTSGGFEYLVDDLMLQNRLYLNDGNASSPHFTKSFDTFPVDRYADSSVETIDFDRDGDLDLFVTGTVIPQNYPLPNPSRLFRNDKGKFVKVENPVFENLGLMKDACVLDFDKDGYDDIVAVGEWTGIVRLKNNHGNFERLTDDLDNLTGFWQSINANDFDNDGDKDLIVGNYGLNSQWRASQKEPMSLEYEDFDDNNRLDPIMSYFIQGKNYPAFSRDELLDQLIPLKKQYTNHELYASATTEEILKKFPNKTPQKRQITTLSTIYLVNNNGKFEQQTLPIEAQFSPVCAILSEDLNNDGFKDLVLGGNQFHGRVRTGNMDANHGQVFLNDKKGHFQYLPQRKSGLEIKGEIRGFALINRQLIVGLNSQKAQIYSLK